MKRLITCSSCQRYIRVHETSCPFCSVAVPIAKAAPTRAANPRGRSRAAVFAVRAALAAGAAPGLLGCGGEGDTGTRDTQRDFVAAGGNAGSAPQASGTGGTGGTADVANPSGGSGGTLDLGTNAGSGGEPEETQTADAGAEPDGGFAPVPIYGGVFPDPTRRARV